MPHRRRRTAANIKFKGLELSESSYAATPDKAIIANNLVCNSGSITLRSGRLELSEDQRIPAAGLGMFRYSPPSAAARSIIIVRADGIYLRTDNG